MSFWQIACNLDELLIPFYEYYWQNNYLYLSNSRNRDNIKLIKNLQQFLYERKYAHFIVSR